SSDALASRLEGCVLIDVTTRPSGRDASGKVRLALRWMLILATALLLSPPGARPLPQGFDLPLLLAFAASNAFLMFLPARRLPGRTLEYIIVIADTFLVSLALFHAR